jgi:hypothetical protein
VGGMRDARRTSTAARWRSNADGMFGSRSPSLRYSTRGCCDVRVVPSTFPTKNIHNYKKTKTKSHARNEDWIPTEEAREVKYETGCLSEGAGGTAEGAGQEGKSQP